MYNVRKNNYGNDYVLVDGGTDEKSDAEADSDKILTKITFFYW